MSRTKGARAGPGVGAGNATLPGLAKTEEPAATDGDRVQPGDVELLISILRKPTDAELDRDPDVARTWSTIATACRDRDGGTWAGLTGLQSHSKRLGGRPVSRHALRIGLRDLVDAGVLRVRPDPAAGGRLPD